MGKFVPLFDVSGIVMKKGLKCKSSIQVGDAVFGDLDVKNGGAAEYVVASEHLFAKKPDNVSFEEAAAVPLAGLTSYQSLVKYGQLKPGQSVVIVGASGGTGVAGVQYAKALGAKRIIGVCSTRNIDFVKSLGATEVIDYTKQDFGDALAPNSIDVVYDCVGGKDKWISSCKILVKNGIFATIALDSQHPGILGLPLMIAGIGKRKLFSYFGQPAYYPILKTLKNADKELSQIADWMQKGIVKSHIEKVYPMSEYKEMFERIQSQRTVGKLVMSIAPQSQSINSQ
jgi:NADPH:quinone reductase-like Zn-dependent oxidoreductase